MQFSGYDTNQLVKEAQNRWLKPAEVLFILQNHENHKLTETPPIKPHSGSLFLFNKRVLRFFRKDGHLWRRKKDGRTVGEAHERLKVGNVEALNCYYAHGEHNPNFQRRSFWMLDPAYEHIVLVHYREITEGKHGAGPSTLSSPSSSCISTQSPSLSNAQNPASTSAVSELYEPYQSSFSPGSVEVSSEFMIRNNGMDHLDGKIRSGDVHNSSGSEVSQALRRIEEQLSLNDDDRDEFSLYYNQEEKLKDSGVLIYERTNHDGLAAVQRKEDDARYHRDADKLDDKNCNMFLQNSVHNRKQHQQLFGSEYRIERKDSPYWKEMLELCSGLTAIDSHEDIVNTSPDSEKPLFLERKENSVNLTDQTDNWTHQWLNFNGNDSESKKKYNATSENNLSLKAARQFLFGSDNPTVSPTSLSLSHGVENPGLTLYSSQTTNQANPEYYTMWFDQESQIGNLGSDSNLTLAQKQKFSIQTICPEWGYATENTKVIVAGSFLCDPSMCSWACMFGDIEVPVQIIQEGVFLCHAPPNAPGKVTLCITSGNKESCSEVREFEYLMKTSYDNSNSPQMTAAKSPEELLLIVRLAQMLLSDPMVQKENGVQSVFDVLRKPKRDDYLWECIIEELLVSSKTPIVVMDWLLQEFLKEKMLQWLSSKYNEGGMPGCSLSKKEQCIIHMVASLGYEWALNPILHSGISVDFRDVNGWTALHWAARFGREKMVAALIAADASAGAVTDPTSQDPAGKTPGFIAAASGHKGLAGYLSELALTSHLSSLTLEESEICKGSAAVEAEKTVQNISKRSLGYCEDQLSLKDSLAAVRNAAQAAARIQSAFRAHSFRKRQVEEAARTRYDEYGLTEGYIDELFATSKLGFRNFRNHKLDKAALSIQKKYRGWKSRKDFLAVRQKVVRIQAHVRGHQVRKKYKVLWAVGVLDKVVLRWRRRGAGLRGFRPESESIDESEDEDILKVFRKQKVDVAIDDAFSRVLSMVESPDARQQYRRMLGSYQEAKAELSSNVSAAASSCPGNNDDLANDIDECYMFP